MRFDTELFSKSQSVKDSQGAGHCYPSEHRLWTHYWVHIMAPPLESCLTLGKMLDLSVVKLSYYVTQGSY